VPYGVRAVDPDEHALQSASEGRYGLKWVSPDYFDVLETPLLRGRMFSEADDAGAEPAMIVNRAFVETYLRTVPDPLGAVVQVREAGFFPPRPFTVVGVVANVLHEHPSQPVRAAVYIPIAQRGELWDQSQGFARDVTFLVWVDPEAGPNERVLRGVISELDPTLVVGRSTTLEALYDALSGETRFWLALLTAFGVVALVLAAAGTFALLAQAVRHRTREIAVRRALGASTHLVLGAVLKDAMALTAIGLILGLAASWYLSRLLEARVVGVGGMEVVPVVGVTCVLLAAAAAAAWIPARWACRVDPAEALRGE
jgi:putative ABC transport system permease protein